MKKPSSTPKVPENPIVAIPTGEKPASLIFQLPPDIRGMLFLKDGEIPIGVSPPTPEPTRKPRAPRKKKEEKPQKKKEKAPPIKSVKSKTPAPKEGPAKPEVPENPADTPESIIEVSKNKAAEVIRPEAVPEKKPHGEEPVKEADLKDPASPSDRPVPAESAKEMPPPADVLKKEESEKKVLKEEMPSPDAKTEPKDFTEDAMVYEDISASRYFSHKLTKEVERIMEFDDEVLIRKMTEELHDEDGDAMREILQTFRMLQHDIAQLDNEPGDETYSQFQISIQKFFEAMAQYVQKHPAKGLHGVNVNARKKAKADTDLERDALGERIKLLVWELQEMVNTFLPWNSLAHKAGSRLFSGERAAKIREYIVVCEGFLGPRGLKFKGPLAEPLARTKNFVRKWLFWAAAAGGLVIGVWGTSKVVSVFRGEGTAEESADSAQALPANLTEEQQRQQKVDEIFAGMTVDLKDDELHVTFADLAGLRVNETLGIYVGPGSFPPARIFNEESGVYVLHLAPGELQPGTQLSVGIQASFKDNEWLTPKDASDDPKFKILQITG